MSHMSFIPKQRNINDVLSLEHLFIHLDVFFEKTHKTATKQRVILFGGFFDPNFFQTNRVSQQKPGSKMTNLQAQFFLAY